MVAFYLSDQSPVKYSEPEGPFHICSHPSKAYRNAGKNGLHVEPLGFIFYVQQ